MTDHTIAESDTGIRLDRWFKRHYPDLRHALLEKALRKGDIRLQGKKAEASARIEAGQVITIRHMPSDGAAPAPTVKVTPTLSEADIEMMQAAVIHKDSDILVLNKPPGLAVQGGTKVTKSVDGLLDALRFDAKERPKLVHRLDRDTSGALVIARSTAVAARLMQAFAGKKMQKIYWALVCGVPDAHEGVIDAPLGKLEDGYGEKMAIDEEEGKNAITHFRVIERLSSTLAWMELQPVTGRTHQLRVHMASIGHPIVGDGKYGGRDAFLRGMSLSAKLHLHARRIVIPGRLDVTAELPRHMRETFETLGLEA